MSKPFLPHNEHMMINFTHLEMVWQMLAAPGKHQHIQDAIDTLKKLNRDQGPEKAIFNMIAVSAWLTDDGASSGGD